MSAICCNEYLNFGCYDLCDVTVSNLNVVAGETADYIVKFTKGGITHTVTVAGVDGEPLVISNEFPVGTTYFTITDPDNVTTCYYIKIERSEAVCPDVIVDDKTLSTC